MLASLLALADVATYSLVALPSFGSFRNSRAKAPIRNAETSVRVAFSKNTKDKAKAHDE
jgi:hypothetical protein